MHQSAWDLHPSIDNDVPFPHAKNRKIIVTDFEKIDKVFVTDIHTYIHTYQSDVIEPPAGVQLAVFQARLIIFLIEEALSRISVVPKMSQHFPN